MYKLNDKTMKCINDTIQECLGMSYEEYSLLDCDEQQKLMNDYHSKHPKEHSGIIFIGDDCYLGVIEREEIDKHFDSMYGDSSFEKVKRKTKNILGGK